MTLAALNRTEFQEQETPHGQATNLVEVQDQCAFNLSITAFRLSTAVIPTSSKEASWSLQRYRSTSAGWEHDLS